jgi:hypothetical protein
MRRSRNSKPCFCISFISTWLIIVSKTSSKRFSNATRITWVPSAADYRHPLRLLGMDAEQTLSRANVKFERRFRAMERALSETETVALVPAIGAPDHWPEFEWTGNRQAG